MSAAQAKRPHRPRPVVFVWTGEHMVPLPRFQQLCDRQFAVHEEYALVIMEERSQASHNHYFAALTEAWKNLAEEYAADFPTMESLRHWALVQTGYCTETSYATKDNAEAKKLAVSLRRASPYAVLQVRRDVVMHFEAESQSRPAMKKERFEASKADVLELVASMARTTPAALKKNAGRSA